MNDIVLRSKWLRVFRRTVLTLAAVFVLLIEAGFLESGLYGYVFWVFLSSLAVSFFLVPYSLGKAYFVRTRWGSFFWALVILSPMIVLVWNIAPLLFEEHGLEGLLFMSSIIPVFPLFLIAGLVFSLPLSVLFLVCTFVIEYSSRNRLK